ncbi:methyltransferase-like protein 7A [Alligator sinensis]|uniref:Methyltransferase-like protein 7A n=1 Tax=Alligator sinensis TaxID=38654 RepID=A0A1U7SHY9_ALLSI|nr:methyltransferase-like protein 7A [Alligator sinensis]
MAEAAILFLRVCVQLLALPIYLLSFLGVWKPFGSKVFFPFFIERFSEHYNQKTSVQKWELFHNLREFTGSSKVLRLLEIGTGTGTNFQFYPPGCRITCSDTNSNFQRGLSKSMNQNQHLQFEHFLVAPAENLNQVADGSMDVVVCTLVLCSVQNVEDVLKEVKRVLRPGGAFYFLEHVAADHSSWSYFWQQVLYPTWKLVFNGCCLTREPWKEIEKAKFSEVKLRHISVPLWWTPLEAHVIGYAVK